MRNPIQNRGPNGNFDIVFDSEIKEFASDGIAQMLIGVPNTKVSFYSSAGVVEEGIERREVKFQVVMSNLAWLELINLVASHLKVNDPQLQQVEAAQKARITELLAAVQQSSVAPDVVHSKNKGPLEKINIKK